MENEVMNNGKWGYEQYGNTSHVLKTKYQPCF